MGNALHLYRGDDKGLSLTFTENGSSLDITGFSIWFTAKTDPSLPDGSAVIQSITTSHTSAVSGLSTISLTNAQTGSLVEGQYYYDIQYKTNTGSIYTAVRDYLVVDNDITKGG